MREDTGRFAWLAERVGGRLALALVLGLAVVLWPLSIQAGDSAVEMPASATPLPANYLPIDRIVVGVLEGAPDGRVAHYTFAYPGDGSTLIVEMEVHPDKPDVLAAVDLRVLGPTPGREYARATVRPGIIPNMTASLTSDQPGIYTVEIVNRHPTIAIGYALVVSDVGTNILDDRDSDPAGSPTTLVPARNPAPVRGNLAASAQGSFVYYPFAYPGGGQAYSIHLHVTPESAVERGLVGFRVYGPVEGRVYAQAGQQIGTRPNLAGNLIDSRPGTYVVQIFSHAEVAVAYEVSVVTP